MMDSVIIEFNIREQTARQIVLSDVAIDAHDDIIYWVHCNLNDEASFKAIDQRLQLPKNVIDLCSTENKLPTFIDDDEWVTLSIECALSTDPLADTFDLDNLIIHLNRRFCFTATFAEQPVIEEFFYHYEKFIPHAKTSCFMLFLMLDNTINDYAKLLFNYELLVDELELKVRTFEKDVYQNVMDNKLQIMKIKRNIIAIQEILMRISGRNISVISKACSLSLRNLSNHSHLVVNEADSIREIFNDLLNQVDNALMQKMNQTMKLLTGFAAIFLPLTLITGIYGMNFRWIPELSWQYGYFYAISLLVGCGFAMLSFFKKHDLF